MTPEQAEKLYQLVKNATNNKFNFICDNCNVQQLIDFVDELKSQEDKLNRTQIGKAVEYCLEPYIHQNQELITNWVDDLQKESGAILSVIIQWNPQIGPVQTISTTSISVDNILKEAEKK